MLAVFGRINPHLRRSITFDNDTAFAQHRPAQDDARHDHLVLRRLCLMAKRRRRKRQWTLIVLTTNLTPRKCLGFKTPFQALLAELGKDVQILLTSLRFAPESRPAFPDT
jgi:IS30 family transposase